MREKIRKKASALIQIMRNARGGIPVLLGIAGASALVAITWQISDSIHQGHIEQLSAQHAIQLKDTTSAVEGINQSIVSTTNTISSLSLLVHNLRASIGNTSMARLAEVKEINRMHENAFKSLLQYVTANQKYFNDPKTLSDNLTNDFDQYKIASDTMVVHYKKYFITFSEAIGELEHTLIMGTDRLNHDLQAAVSQLEKVRDSSPRAPIGMFIAISPGSNSRTHQLEQRIKDCKSRIAKLDALKKELKDIKNRQQLAPPEQE